MNSDTKSDKPKAGKPPPPPQMQELGTQETARMKVRSKAMSMRIKGYSVPAIAQVLTDRHPALCKAAKGGRSCDRPSASTHWVRTLIREALAEHAADIALSVDDLRAEADHRLREAQGRLWKVADDGQTPPAVKVQALRGFITAEDRRIRLHGLDQERKDSALADLAAGLLQRLSEGRSFHAASQPPPRLAADKRESLAKRPEAGQRQLAERGLASAAVIEGELVPPRDRAVALASVKPAATLADAAEKAAT